MNTFFITFGVFIIFVIAMAVGYIFQRKSVTGSCGGLGAVGIEKVCNCPEPCDARKKREAKAAARERLLAQWENDRIV